MNTWKLLMVYINNSDSDKEYNNRSPELIDFNIISDQ